jgi:hypothetical protein
MRVRVSEAEVAAFKKSWPCSGLPSCAVVFEFAANGDLIDLDPFHFDGTAAAALAESAQAGRVGIILSDN